MFSEDAVPGVWSVVSLPLFCANISSQQQLIQLKLQVYTSLFRQISSLNQLILQSEEKQCSFERGLECVARTKRKRTTQTPRLGLDKLIRNYTKPIHLAHITSQGCYKPHYLPCQLPLWFLEHKLGKSREVSHCLKLRTNLFLKLLAVSQQHM